MLAGRAGRGRGHRAGRARGAHAPPALVGLAGEGRRELVDHAGRPRLALAELRRPRSAAGRVHRRAGAAGRAGSCRAHGFRPGRRPAVPDADAGPARVPQLPSALRRDLRAGRRRGAGAGLHRLPALLAEQPGAGGRGRGLHRGLSGREDELGELTALADLPSRIVVVDGDPQTVKLCERALRPPRFEAFLFDDACPALMSLRDLAPDLIVCTDHMPWIDLKAFKRTVRSAAPLVEVPFLFLASDDNGQREIEAVLSREDQCLRKPVTSDALLEAIRKGARPASQRLGRQSLLSGNVDRGGLLGLLKLCEDAQLTGRLLFEAREHVLWFDWLAGAPVGHGASPADPQRDALDRLLDADGGRYTFEPRPIGERGAGAAGAPSAAQESMGSFSVLEVEGRRYQVHTESVHSPNFAVRTIVAAFGQALRKLETTWPHPMKRQHDSEQTRVLIDRQHDGAMKMVRDGLLAPQARRKVWDVIGGGVEGSQLLWVMTLLRDLARERLGSLASLALLRRSQRRLARFYPALEAFVVADDGRVSVRVDDQAAARTTLSGWRLPRGAVRAVAAWALAFRDEAMRLAGPPRLPTLRKATRMIARDLDEIG